MSRHIILQPLFSFSSFSAPFCSNDPFVPWAQRISRCWPREYIQDILLHDQWYTLVPIHNAGAQEDPQRTSHVPHFKRDKMTGYNLITVSPSPKMGEILQLSQRSLWWDVQRFNTTWTSVEASLIRSNQANRIGIRLLRGSFNKETNWNRWLD